MSRKFKKEKRRVLRQTILAAIVILSTLIMPSCLIKEDMSNCPEDIRVYFDITTPAEADDINPADVDRMNLYVFCNKGYYLGEYRDDHVNYSANYYISCSDLIPGEYRFIAWAGKDEACFSTTPNPFIKGKTRFEEALLTLNHHNNVVANKVHHLFYSDLDATVTNEKLQRFLMPLTQQTNTINIYTVGLPPDANAYTFEIADNNCSYLFDSSFAGCLLLNAGETFKYTAECEKDGANLYSTLNVMRLAADRPTPQLRVVNETNGTLLYPTGTQSGNLIELIKRANPENDFEATHTYDIILIFDGGDPARFPVTILINGWEVREQNGELVE